MKRSHHTTGTAAPTTAPPPARRLHEVDALRIGAAVTVLLYHYTFAFAHTAGAHTTVAHPTVAYPALSVITRYGYLGVDLFFTISGFVVLLSAIGRRPGQFVISRIVRLYPAYWVAVTLTTLVLTTLGPPDAHVTVLRYLANLTMLNSLPNIQNIDVVYWTLWAELRFYVVVLLLTLWGITRGRILGVLWSWLALSTLLDLDILPRPLQNLATLALQPEWAHYFIAGMALCLIYRYGPTWQPAVIVVLAFIRAVPTALTFAANVGQRYHEDINPIAVATIVTAIFLTMIAMASGLTQHLGRPWFATAGALTYPLYLIHDAAGAVLFNRLDNLLNRWVLLATISTAMAGAAWLIHRYVERPLAPALKRHLNTLLDRGTRTPPPT